MTKRVRIENADTSDHKLVVEVWHQGTDGQPDTVVETINLDFPTALAEINVWSSRYIVIREAL